MDCCLIEHGPIVRRCEGQGRYAVDDAPTGVPTASGMSLGPMMADAKVLIIDARLAFLTTNWFWKSARNTNRMGLVLSGASVERNMNATLFFWRLGHGPSAKWSIIEFVSNQSP